MNRLILIALFLLGLCAGSAFGQYPAGCSKAATPSGFTGCELWDLKKVDKEAMVAKSDKDLQLSLLKRHYIIEALLLLPEHAGMVYQDASSAKNTEEKADFQAKWPDGRLVPKGTK